MKIGNIDNQKLNFNRNLSLKGLDFPKKIKTFREVKTDVEMVKLIDKYLTYTIGESQFDYEFSLNLNKAKDRNEKLPIWLESLKDTYKKVDDLASIDDDEYISTREFQNILVELMANLQLDSRYGKYMSENYIDSIR